MIVVETNQQQNDIRVRYNMCQEKREENNYKIHYGG